MNDKRDWYWCYDSTEQQLQLMLDNELAVTISHPRRNLQDNLPERTDFSITDCEFLQKLLDYLECHAQIAVSQQFQLAIQATAFMRFGKPLLPQSWHFQISGFESWPANVLLCRLNSGFSHAECIILEQDDQLALCMVADGQLTLTNNKVLKAGQVVRVAVDRLQESMMHRLPTDQQHDWQNFA